MTTERTVEAVATEARKFLVRSPDKKSDTTSRNMLVPTDDAPNWFTDLCRAAHDAGSIGPNDWRYEFIDDALSDLEDGAEDVRDLDDVYPYTHDRLNWLASHLDRPSYCDEAAEEFGTKTDKVLDLIALGMAAEMREVFEAVKLFCAERVEADEVE
jgi:hypothetical protein